VAAPMRPVFARLMAGLVRHGLLREKGEGFEPAADFAEAAGSAGKVLRNYIETHPGHLPEALLCEGNCTELGSILRGDKDAVQVLFSGIGAELLDHLYGDGLFTSHWVAAIAAAVSTAGRSLPEGRGLRILEIGAGTGNLTAQLIPRVVYWATDINPLYLMYLENVGRNRPYMKVGFTNAEKAESYPQDQKFDTVICLNVVEHLVNDRGALVNLRAALEDGGRAIILVPCGPGLYGTLDEVLGHQRRYTRKSLEELVTKAEFKLESMLEFNRAGVIAWWLNGRVLRRRTFGLGQIMALNLLTPVFRLIDKFLPWAPLSLIAVARKPASADLRKDAPRDAVTGSGLQEQRLPTT